MTDKEKFIKLFNEIGIKYTEVESWCEGCESIEVDDSSLEEEIYGAGLRIDFDKEGTFKKFITTGE